ENVEPKKNVVSEEDNVSVASEITVNPPVGLVIGSPRENVLEVVYGPCGMDGVARYVIYLDGKAIKEDAQVAFYTFENIEPGEHKVQVTAVLEDGSESDKSKCESTIVVLGEVKEESSDEVTTTEEATTEEAEASEYMNFESATTSIYCGSDWAGATAEVEEDGDTAIIKASNFGGNGSNEWAIQYKIDGIDVIQGAEYTLSCDLLSDIDKKIVIKLDDAAGVIFETISLKAGEAYHFEKTSAPMPQAQTQLFFAPGTMGGDEPNQSGNITISKLKLTTQEVVEEPEEKPEDKPVVQTGDVIAISESKESATVGEDITLTFFENKDFSDAISEVLVNGQAVSFDKDSDSIDIDGSYFTSAGVYDIKVKADGYTTAKVYQQVFAEDIWELVFADEFDGNSLDTNIWSYQNGTGAEYGLNGWGNEEEQYYTSDNLSVGDGTLTIEAKKESIGGKTYTSSRIRSLAEGNQGFSTTYGRIEAKIKMPAGDGIWPAFWMLPSTDDYGTWASSGEIDIM
ncbi:MAG: glycoside hydrolase family 16 protein, partial [Lachnospiraceae bacterium]|nr:glycoside hydrolase family 16 protein [Lachnospiraceae bacterium]